MNVLSLFDGISCGRLALQRAGIPVEKYYASEIDKHAIRIAQYNFPDTIQIGDVKNVKGYHYPNTHLLLAGTPCQSFSVAGDGTGFEGKSGLIHEYVRVLNELRELNPNVLFLLENVKMKKEWRDRISEMLGVEPIEINSALVSAQNRRRLYWTNIKGIVQPADKGIFLKDILEDNVSDEFEVTGKHAVWLNNNKEFLLDKNYISIDANKALTLRAREYANWNGNFVKQLNPSLESGDKQPYMQNRVYDINGKSVALTKFADRLNIMIPLYLTEEEEEEEEEERVRYLKGSKQFNRTKNGHESLSRCTNYVAPPFCVTETRTEEAKRIRRENQKNGRDYSPRRGKELKPRTDNKSNCLTSTMTVEHTLFDTQSKIRKLTPVECERLQTIPDNYSLADGISNSQRYKALGNGWTIDVISHIFSFISLQH